MRIGIYSNLDRDIDGNSARKLYHILTNRGHEVFLSDKLIGLGIDAPLCNKKSLASKVEIVAVLGGDGTVLPMAKECALHASRILAVNFGHLGFLSEVEKIDEIEGAFERIERGEFFTETRAIMDVCCGNEQFAALNEVVIARSLRSKIVRLKVKVNNNTLNTYSADGLIVCTPTGSTAYSLSAGGPVVAPEVKAFIITPICPHSLNSRSYVISDDSDVAIELTKFEGQADLVIDGTSVKKLQEGDQLRVTRSAHDALFIRLKKYNYYRKLLAKMNTLN